MKQFKLPRWVGAWLVQMTYSMYWIGLFNTLLIAVTAWHTTLAWIITPVIPWFTFPVFIALVVVIFSVIVPVLDYKFLWPTRQGFINQQSYIHDNPVKRDIDKLKKDMGKVLSKLGVEE